MSDVFAPEGGFRVRVLDLSGASEDNVVEEVRGFPTLMHANAFARAYVRDSVERCRLPGASTRDVLSAWFAFGEDVLVVDDNGQPLADGQGWRSANELDEFAAHPGSEIECGWRALDPRLDQDEADDDDQEEETSG